MCSGYAWLGVGGGRGRRSLELVWTVAPSWGGSCDGVCGPNMAVQSRCVVEGGQGRSGQRGRRGEAHCVTGV